MNKLFYVTGDIESSFFTNEIQYFCDSFDSVYVLAYNGNKKKCNEIAHHYGFEYEFINTTTTRLKSLASFLSWTRRQYVVDELRKHCSHSIKKKAYVFLYGLHAVAVESIISKHLKETEDDIFLYSFWLSRPAFSIASMNIKRDFRVKRIASRTHRYDLYEEENELSYLPFRSFLSENLDTIYFSSRDTFDYYKNKRYSDSKKQAQQKLSYLGTQKTTVKTKKNSSEVVIASCSYMIQRKRLDLIIKVIKYMSTLGCPVKWIHIGDGELKNSIQDLAAEELASSKVDYIFTGILSDDDIYVLYHRENIDFFINMSDSEGIPVSLLEAMSMGVPTIARKVGGIADAIIDGVNGMLVEADAIDEDSLGKLAGRIVNTFTDDDAYYQMSQNAHMHWSDVFDGERNARKVCEDLILSNAIEEYRIGGSLASG